MSEPAIVENREDEKKECMEDVYKWVKTHAL